MLFLALQADLTRTWASCDLRAEALVVHDADGDGLGDACVRIGGAWLVARTVEGWKASGWRGAESFGAALATELERRANEAGEGAPRLGPPPWEPEAEYVFSASGDVDGDGKPDTLRAFRCAKPGAFLEAAARAQRPAPARQRWRRAPRWLGVHGLPRGIGAGNAKLDPARPDVLCAWSRPTLGSTCRRSRRQLCRSHGCTTRSACSSGGAWIPW